MATETITFRCAISRERMQQITIETIARMGRLSRKARKREKLRFMNRVLQCVRLDTVSTMEIQR